MIYVFIIALAAAWLLGRNPATLLRIRFRAPFLLIGCLLIQIGLSVWVDFSHRNIPILLVCTFLGTIIGLFLNRKLKGMLLIFGGACLNAVALMLNGGTMPVSVWAMKAAGLSNAALIQATNSRHQLANHVMWLGDWIPVVRHVLSPGDILVAIGLIAFIIGNSKKREST